MNYEIALKFTKISMLKSKFNKNVIQCNTLSCFISDMATKFNHN